MAEEVVSEWQSELKVIGFFFVEPQGDLLTVNHSIWKLSVKYESLGFARFYSLLAQTIFYDFDSNMS